MDTLSGGGGGDSANTSWEDLIKQAYFARINLCAHGFYSAPGKFKLNFAENRAHAKYFTQGASLFDVEYNHLIE